jgi:arylsulfatase A-like enzyme
MREPAIAWWPGHIPAGRVTSEIASSLDLMPTFVSLAGGTLPDDRPIDGVNQTPLLLGTGPGQRDRMFYYRGAQLFAVRHGPFKLHYQTRAGYGQARAEVHDPPLLFHLPSDPSERFDVAKDNPGAIAAIEEIVAEHRAKLVPGEPQLEARVE